MPPWGACAARTGQATARRAYATQARPRVYVSRTQDPYLNLAWEDFVFRTTPGAAPACFFYVNEPCVVIGRNQNIWSEVDARAMREHGVALVRRLSGGGTVYHDEGNMNFSFHTDKASFVRKTHTELVARALRRPPISLPARFEAAPVFRNERNDLVAYAADAREARESELRKVSGSAYKLANQRAYHHGTLLIDADLRRLSALRPRAGQAERITTTAVASVPSPVANLRELFPSQARQLTYDHLVEAIGAEFERTYGPCDYVDVDHACLDQTARDARRVICVRDQYDTLQTWDWVYGSSPRFRITASTDTTPHDSLRLTLTLTCEHGVVTGVDVDAPCAATRASAQQLVGVRFDALVVPPPTSVPPSACAVDERLQAWLRRAL